MSMDDIFKMPTILKMGGFC